MKKQINEVKRMQVLAGILKENSSYDAPVYDYEGKELYVDNQSGEPDEEGGQVSLYDKEGNEYTATISSIDGEGMIYVDQDTIEPVM